MQNERHNHATRKSYMSFLSVLLRPKTSTDLCNMKRCAVTVVQPNAIKQSEINTVFSLQTKSLK